MESVTNFSIINYLLGKCLRFWILVAHVQYYKSTWRLYSSLNSASDTFSARTSAVLIILFAEAGNMPMEQEYWKIGKMKNKTCLEVLLSSKSCIVPCSPHSGHYSSKMKRFFVRTSHQQGLFPKHLLLVSQGWIYFTALRPLCKSMSLLSPLFFSHAPFTISFSSQGLGRDLENLTASQECRAKNGKRVMGNALSHLVPSHSLK